MDIRKNGKRLWQWVRPWFLQRDSTASFAVAGFLVSGAALGSIVGLSQVQIAVAQGYVGNLLANPWFVMGIVAGVVALFFFFSAVTSTSVQKRERKKSPLTITDDSSMEGLVVDGRYSSIVSLRVGNSSDVGLMNVRLRVLGGRPGRPGHFLRVQHDDTPPYEWSHLGDYCPAGGSVYFYVAHTAADVEEIHIMYANEKLEAAHPTPKSSAMEPHSIILMAEARWEDTNQMTVPKVEEFEFWLIQPGMLRLKGGNQLLEP